MDMYSHFSNQKQFYEKQYTTLLLPLNEEVKYLAWNVDENGDAAVVNEPADDGTKWYVFIWKEPSCSFTPFVDSR